MEETNDVVRRDGDARDDEEGGQDLPPHTHDEVKIFQPFLLHQTKIKWSPFPMITLVLRSTIRKYKVQIISKTKIVANRNH